MKNYQHKISFFFSISLMLLGFIVLLSWCLKWDPLIQIHPSFTPMQFNTALCFLIGGTALLFANLSKPIISQILAGLLIAISIATLTEYVSGKDCGIDQIFFKPHITTNSPYPGRMALNTNICFLLAGISIITTSFHIKQIPKFLTPAIFNSIVFSLSIVAVTGYIIGIENTYGWVKYSAMAVHTSCGFVALSCGIFLFLWQYIKNGDSIVHIYRPFITGISAITITILFWQAFAHNQDIHKSKRVENELKNLKHDLTTKMQPQIHSLIQMADRWKVEGKQIRKNWESDAMLYIEYNKNFQAIEWVNTNFIVRWVIPLEGNEQAQDLDLSFNKNLMVKLQKAMKTGKVSIPPVIDLRQGGKGLLVYVPIISDESFEGFILGVFKVKDLIENLINKNYASGIIIKIYENNNEIYNNTKGSTLFSKYKHETDLNFYGRPWKIKVWPSMDLVKTENSFILTAILICGFIISALLTFASFIRLKEKLHSKNLKETNKRLSLEINKRKTITKALHKSASLVNSVLNNILDGVITIDEKGTILSFNKESEHIFGYSQNEVLHKNIKMLMPEPDKANHDSYLSNYIKTSIPKIIGIGREVVGLRKDGSTFPMDLGVSKLNVEGTRHFTGIVRDITAQKRAVHAILIAKKEAEQANEAKSKFLAHMSHDLRTPLNSVLGFAQLLALDLNKTLTKEQSANVQRIEKSGRHLLTLINEILDLSRIESGAFTVATESINTAKLTAELISDSQPIATKYGITIIDKTMAAKPTYITADNTRLKQVLLNLLSNAIKYNSNDGSVTISLENKKERLRINIIDTGPGISEENQTMLFEPFNRLDADCTNIEGTGIGLTIAKQLTEKMGGIIGVESTLGKGSCFYVEIPISQITEKTENLSDSDLKINKNNDEYKNYKYVILYIEDNIQNFKLVEAFLLSMRKHITLLHTNEAKSGIEMARTHQPNLILMDINLPGMDGLEAFGILKRQNETRNIPIVVVSADAMKESIENALDAGFDSYITKPINLKNFLKVVDKFDLK